ncbi:syntaxin 5, putative [Theileria equi strain WA]|uniref:Syntaxin 5, putative n=1 Tax=Theileria equi strain WA TaxID=1537102 RepID=L0AVY1_THEEQ|nr:syntaxin 5, putative [Theileria equi strain WA]AFZ79191.1 syntaxin 5, putative [Theileria equi strain WA]|eukprot:XP_004828857.1 syntaxin 5, putative [Theileria equi strain WA]
MVSSVDRTSFFKREIAKNPNSTVLPTISKNNETRQFESEADVIHKELAKAKSKLSELSQLVRKRSLYLDNTNAIEQLTAQIKGIITNASNSIDTFETRLQNTRSNNEHTKLHHENMIALLRKQLFEATKSLKDLLHQRTQIMMEQESRRKLYSQNDLDSVPNWSVGRKRFMMQDLEADQQIDLESGEDMRPSVSLIADAKAEALANVQRAIGDLTQIFQRVTTYVVQQDEMIKRIDADTDISLDNIKTARNELVKYYNRISSNRTLVLKVFFLFVAFTIFYIMFLT